MGVGDHENRGSWTTVHGFHSDVSYVYVLHLKYLLKLGYSTFAQKCSEKDLKSDEMWDRLYVI